MGWKVKTQSRVKDPWKKNAYAEKAKHAGKKRGLVDREREMELDRQLSNWKKDHAELDKTIRLDY